MSEIYEYLNEQLESLNINYQYGEWVGDKEYPFFVGKISGVGVLNESGLTEYQAVLTGATTSNIGPLIEAVSVIKNHFIHDSNKVFDSGNLVIISYDNMLELPIDESPFRRIEIYLKIFSLETGGII